MLRLRMAPALFLASAMLVASAMPAMAQTAPAGKAAPAAPAAAPAEPEGPADKGQKKRSKTELIPQTYEDSTRFLKSIPPKPDKTWPYPSINTPPIEDKAPVPLLTEVQRKQLEDELTKLNEKHQKGMPKIKPGERKDNKERKKKRRGEEKTDPGASK